MSFRAKGEPRHRTSLPFHSVDTLEEARHIQLTHCKCHYDGRYILNEWSGDVEDIMNLADKLGLE